MADVKKLIEEILSNAKLAKSRNITTGVYRDEPILKTAAQIVNQTPPPIREMRKIAGGYGFDYSPGVKLFYQQGKLMENYEDDFDYRGEFVRYFPTYQSMSDMQLRGYFSWRTKVRRGSIEKTSLSFVFVYIYELLNQIGVKTAEEGFFTLKNFWEAYREMDSHITHYVTLWLKDYIVYHGLDKTLLGDLEDTRSDEALFILLDYPSHSAEEVFQALNSLSSYNLEKSKFFKQNPDDMKVVVRNVFAALSEYYDKNRKNGLCEKLLGRCYNDNYTMFRSAVFFEKAKHKDTVYEVSDICKYRCKNGNWTCERFFYYSNKSRHVGALLKTVDALIRQKYGWNAALKTGKTTKIMTETINREIDRYLEAKRKSALPKIEIDVSKLHGIRKAALETQNKLIVEEDCKKPVVPAPADARTAGCGETGLSETERRFLACLLYGKEYGGLVRSNGLMESVLVDAVNEKLFDRFGDTVIVFDGDTPLVLEDYAEELKGIVRE